MDIINGVKRKKDGNFKFITVVSFSNLPETVKQVTEMINKYRGGVQQLKGMQQQIAELKGNIDKFVNEFKTLTPREVQNLKEMDEKAYNMLVDIEGLEHLEQVD